VRITAAVAGEAEQIAASIRGSNAWPQFQGMAATARATNGSAAVQPTRAGVSGIRSAVVGAGEGSRTLVISLEGYEKIVARQRSVILSEGKKRP
jgi:hypothetical protein